jgi:hypothetical protein
VGIIFISAAVALVWMPIPTFKGEEAQFHILTIVLGAACTLSGYYMLRKCPWR